MFKKVLLDACDIQTRIRCDGFSASILCQSLQMMSGLLSVGVGILFAVTQEMSESLLTLCRLSQLNGAIVSLRFA